MKKILELLKKNSKVEDKIENDNAVKNTSKINNQYMNENEDKEEHKGEVKNENKDKVENNNDINNKIKNQKQSKKITSKLQKISTKIISTKLFIILTAIIILLKTILLYKTSIFANTPITFNCIYITIIFISILCIIPMLLKNKARFIITITINLLTSILLCINEIYYSYATNLVSISQISNLQYGKEISAALPNLVHIRQLLYFIDIILLLILLATKIVKISKNEKNNKIISIIYTIVVIIISSISLPKSIHQARNYQYNKVLQVKEVGIYGYHYLDISNNLNMKKNVKYKTKESMLKEYNNLKMQYSENYQLQYNFNEIAKDKNVIMLQLESIQNFLVNRQINGYEITPNLNKFLKDNIEFTNMQNQSYSSTADSEYSSMNSVYPLENGMSFAQYSTNDYSDIFKMFKNNGYTTTYIHGNEGGFWNRESVYSRLKIDNLLFDNVFDENVERINEYVSDEQVYRKIVDEVKTYDNKFFVNIVAASSHIAFDLPGIENKEEKVKIDVGEQYKNSFFGNYLEAANYADYAFGILIEELKKAGLYDDTVILVFGDHAGLQMYNYEMIDFIEEVTNLNDAKIQINYSNVLCGLKIPGVEPTIINKPVSKLDIKPTLTEICGVEDGFSLGTSMFSSKEFVGLNNARVITDKYFYNGDWFVIETGEKLDMNSIDSSLKEQLEYYNSCLQKELDISLAINILNLLKE